MLNLLACGGCAQHPPQIPNQVWNDKYLKPGIWTKYFLTVASVYACVCGAGFTGFQFKNKKGRRLQFFLRLPALPFYGMLLVFAQFAGFLVCGGCGGNYCRAETFVFQCAHAFNCGTGWRTYFVF